MLSERERLLRLRKSRRNSRRYDARHHATRRMLVPFVESGLARCARGAGCRFAVEVGGELVGGVIEPGSAWDLGHADGGSVGGPEHSVCNRGAPHRNVTSRSW